MVFFLGAYGSRPLPDAAIWWCLRTGGGGVLTRLTVSPAGLDGSYKLLLAVVYYYYLPTQSALKGTFVQELPPPLVQHVSYSREVMISCIECHENMTVQQSVGRTRVQGRRENIS